ncbi:MAG: oligosaccharide flippase family protein [Bacteroidales bacterium]|nr:oligosaccharide flippase family protein [Bacteroidales bacterium]
MGVIRKQTIQGTIYTYLGAGLGVFTNLILLAWFFTPEQIGLLNILVAYSLLFAQLANLGFDNITIRLFPYFRDKASGHHGFFSIMTKVLIIGLFLSILIFIVIFPLLSNNDEGNRLFRHLGMYVIPLIVSTLFFNSLDTYSRVLYKSVRGTFLKEVLQRIFIIIAIGLYIWLQFSFDLFVLLYVLALSIPTLILFYLLYKEKELSFKMEPNFISPKLKKEMWSVSLFGIITVFSSTIVANIDKIMIQQYLDLSQTGLYSIAFFFGVIITMPSRALTKISSTVVAESWKNNDTVTIYQIYYKSCINQLLFSLILFLGIWVNIDALLMFLPSKYAHIQWVVFWICLGSFIDMATGINNTIIGTSPYYKAQSLFMLIFVLIIIATNAIFIPLHGITGAAFASALSLLLFNLIRWLFLLFKYKMQPFDYKFLLTILIGLIAYFAAYAIPEIKPFYFDILVRSIVLAIIYAPLVFLFNISADVNQRINIYWSWLRNKILK